MQRRAFITLLGGEPRRHPKAFGTSSDLLSGTPSSVPCPSFRRHVGRQECLQCVTTVNAAEEQKRDLLVR